MGSDRARISYDPTRKWRGLVAQQGRVTVEADWNEAATIAAADDRHVTLDVVGPVGSPDGGYLVTPGQAGSPPSSSPPSSSTDLTVGKGTLYLGGERLDLTADVDVDNQADWLDPVTGTLWVAPEPSQSSPPGSGNELVYLLAIEQEVGAREDPALADVALGGPDTMQRLRVLQRFVRWPTTATSCTQAWSEVQAAWETIGLSLDAAMQLKSSARLQVGFVTDATPPSPCQPVATGGYLGAENQLIRLQIASVDTNGVPTIVWGYDDATFLYELNQTAPDNSGNVILTLANAPVDSYHSPVAGQAVELLRDAASLTPDDPSASNTYIAAASGAIFTLSQGYNASAGTIAISGDLPAGYQNARQLYLRVWQDSMVAAAGESVTLADIGVTVTLTVGQGTFHPGDYWCFALRPSVPGLIYPARYGEQPQPPEGARVLTCPVAMVTRPAAGAATASSCIPPFDNLVDLTGRGSGCCTLRVTPDALANTSLNTLVSRYVGQGPIKVCFAPGVYTLTEPLVFDSRFNDLTLEGCGGPVTLQAPAQPGSQFLLGLIVLEGTSGVTISGIDLMTPLVPFATSDSFTTLSRALGVGSRVLLEQFSANLRVALGISAQSTSNLVIDNCHFSLDFTGLKVAASIFAAGIFASGTLSETTVTDCVFDTAPVPTNVPFYDLAVVDPTTDARPMPPYRLTFGYLQVPSATWVRASTDDTSASLGMLQDASIENCRFQGITVPALAMGQLGTIRLENNTVQNCFAGFWLFSFADLAQVMALELIPTGDVASNSELVSVGLSALADGIVILALAMARVLPTTPPTADQATGPKIAQLNQASLSAAAQGLRGVLNQALTTLAPAAAAATTPTGTPPPASKLVSNLVSDVHKMFSRQQPTVTTTASQNVAAAAKTVAMPTQSPTQVAAQAAAPVQVSDLVSTLLPVLNNILVNAGATTPAVPVAADTGTTAVLRLALSGNEIDAMVASSYSGPGLLVIDMTSTFGSILFTGNRIANRCPNGQAAVIYTVEDAVAINGNIIANEKPATAAHTLAAVVTPAMAVPATAVTTNTTCSLFCIETGVSATDSRTAPNLPVTIVGNVLISTPILLPSPPLNHWLPFNSVTV